MTKTVETLRDLRQAFERDMRMCAVAGCTAYPTPLSRELFDRAEREGFDMKGFYVPGEHHVRVVGYNRSDGGNAP